MRKLIPAYVRVPLIFAIVFGAMEYFIDSGDKPAFIEYPMVSVFLLVFLFLLIAIEIVLNAVDKVTYSLLTDEQKKKLDEAQSFSFEDSKLMKMLTRSKSIDEEKDVMLDHDYDGIKELDNVLPPWWVGLFWATIVFGLIYIFRFHIYNDYTQDQEYEQEVELAELEVQEYLKNAPDITNKDNVTLLTDAADIAAGKEIFMANCMACHKADGGGSIGPNLTDKFWILGGGIKNVFNTVSEGGRSGKGMVPWKETLKPKEIQKVSSYVLSLQGTNPPDAKPAEGDEWIEEGTAPTDATEATITTVVDSTKTE
ncbi:cbb3-type cytochrome c oxidase N-terminal domain-containing protein [Flavobacterium sp.]|uniref:cbb3-type cytochrome c oxidase N-terminal domain-containing protein n=1 Tax=Flavobacterium sp. TaxID=239 RepID=UPI00352968B9